MGGEPADRRHGESPGMAVVDNLWHAGMCVRAKVVNLTTAVAVRLSPSVAAAFGRGGCIPTAVHSAEISRVQNTSRNWRKSSGRSVRIAFI